MPITRNTLAPGRHQQAGLSLVELMVGIAVGMVVVAGASLMVSAQMSGTRQLLTEVQLQQDLRAAADIITRELRRAGSNAYNNLARDAVSQPTTLSAQNPFSTITPSALNTATATEVGYAYYRTSGAVGGFGFQLSSTGVIEFNLDGTSTGWQALTDGRVLRVTNFTVTLNNGPAVQLPCPKDCPAGGTACFPTWQNRELVVDIEAESVTDPNVRRSIRAATKLRNDVLNPDSATGLVCPS